VEGVKYVLKQFADILKAHGVEEIRTVGEKFDPKYHEAAGEEEVEGKEAGGVVKEVSGGYKVGERVIRAARVIISK
jgi:molecular chaperone GrpE